MRIVFTTATAYQRGLTPAMLLTGERNGRWRKIEKGVWVEGPASPSRIDRAIGTVLRTGGVASGGLAARLHELDSVTLGAPPHVTVPPNRMTRRAGVRRMSLPPERVVRVGAIPCTDGLQTLIDLAPIVDDAGWEQALESALRKKLVTVPQLDEALPALGRSRTPGTPRIRRVLLLRPPGAPATESLLETLMVQLARVVPNLPEAIRQLDIYDEYGNCVARVDLAWPELGLFAELDGQQHKGQPLYDASRQTRVIAVTGWLCGRFTWDEVWRVPVFTARRLEQLADQCRLRPLRAAG
jgi:hypothetical protein